MEEMLSEHKAAAYCPGWREKIERLQRGDTVFLYKNGTGIIAYGIADGKLNKKERDGQADYEYNMHLDKFCQLKKPLSAKDIKELTKSNRVFRHTLNNISEEWREISDKEIKENRI
ncbi:MAG: hypothetical protein Q4F00_05805 [bacterium]|nr:hypothetical protein [bacterium]